MSNTHRYYIWTPAGYPVPGKCSRNIDLLWRWYCGVMNQSREQLEAQGYRAAPRPVFKNDR